MKLRTLIILFLSLIQLNGQSDILFSENGTSNFSIEILDKGLAPLADTLQKYLSLSTKTDFDIGKTKAQGAAIQLKSKGKSLRPTENGCYSVTLSSDRIIIEGDNFKYLEYGIYDFLETHIGLDFLAPGVVHLPEKTIFQLQKGSTKFCSSFGTRTVHSQLFYNNPGFANKHKVTSESFPHYVPGSGVHTFHKFLPADLYLEKHPEYFALRSGRRIPTQLCLSNPEVLNIVIDSVSAQFQRFPNAEVISVSQDDNTQYCTCEHCAEIDKSEGGPTGSMIHFVNKVADAFPDKTISTLAYQYTRKAPENIKPRSNVLITLCSIECDRSASIEKKCQDFEEDLQSWNAIGATLRIWDYTTQFTNFLSPFPNLHTLQDNIQLFQENGAQWVFEQHSRNPSELFELRSYLMAKLLWNPELDAGAVVKNFCDKFYGPASPYVLEYIDEIHSDIIDDKEFFLFLYGDPSQAFSSYLNEKAILKYLDFWEEAQESVKGNPEILQRVKFASLSTKFAFLERCKKNDDPRFSLKKNKSSADVKYGFDEVLNSFESICAENTVILLNEMGYTIREYVNFNKVLALRADKVNKAKNKDIVTLSKPKKYSNADPKTLVDGALGGTNFYANWLGYEGNDLEVIIDLTKEESISNAEVSFLKVVNHIVFYPDQVNVYGSNDKINFQLLGEALNQEPLTKNVKKNDVQSFRISFEPQKYRYFKVVAKSMQKAPEWHHGAGMPSWIFADEIILN